MEYKRQSYTINGFSIDDAGVASVNTGVIIGIVGNTYPQFIAGDTTVILIPDYVNKKGEQQIIEVEAGIDEFIAKKYPDTK